MRAATSTTATPPSGECDQLREGDAVAQAERPTAPRPRAPRAPAARAEAGGVDVDPADAEADAGRAQPVGERHELRLAAASDHDPVQLEALDEALEDRLARARLGERGGQVALELAPRLDPEEAALAARVGRLQHRRQRRRPASAASTSLAEASAGERRLRDAGVGEDAGASRACSSCARATSVPIEGRPSRSVTAATTGTARSADTVSGAVDVMAAGDLGDRVDVGEVDGLADVGDLQPEGVGVAVDADHAQAALARLQDRAALVAPGADEEDGLHCPAMLAPFSAGRPVAAAGTRRAASARSRSRCRGAAGPRWAGRSRCRSRGRWTARRRSRCTPCRAGSGGRRRRRAAAAARRRRQGEGRFPWRGRRSAA